MSYRDIFSFNRYAYANNNPYRYTDPTGLKSEDTDDENNDSDKEKEEPIEVITVTAPKPKNPSSGGFAQQVNDYFSRFDFNFNQFADEVRERRFDSTLVLGSLAASLGIGTMAKTPSKLRGFGPKKIKSIDKLVKSMVRSVR